jgi:hypothetical protein
MKNRQLTLIFILTLLFNPFESNAQLYELGGHLTYNVMKLKVSENVLNNRLTVREGRTFSGGSIGGQFLISPPKKQNVTFFHVIPTVMLEASFCRCGGNIELTRRVNDSVRIFTELKYVQYQVNFSPKFMVGFKNLRVMLGPTVWYNYYSGVREGAGEPLSSANDQFRAVNVGYEFGVAVKLDRFMLSGRYNRHVTDFGQETREIPTVYSTYQYRIMLAYSIFVKHKGSYWNSIKWDK